MQPGDKLGSYEILSALARGGAGESWRARDARVGREVALHVLPEDMAEDESRRVALDHRARVLASLDHPAIARVYGLEESDGTWFLVTEPVGGETLAERLGRGPLPIDEALRLGLGVARGVAAAHEKNIVHRDLNPSKIRIASDGQAKILDFPLANVTASDASGIDISQSPTLSVAGSGTIPGTPAYMSPEQARGEAADAAADVWAFGCVLFQMLAGHPAFEGETDSDLLASVLRTEPDWDRLPPGLHPRLRYALERCLEKPVGDRSPDLAGVAADIEKTLEDPEGAAAHMLAAPARPSWIPWAAALVAAGALAGVAGWALSSPEDSGVVRFGMATPSGGGQAARILHAVSPELGISRDGSRVVFRGRDGGIYLRDLGDVTPRPVQIAEETGLRTEPVFSPDGDELLYVDHPDGGVSFGGPLLYISPEMAGFAGGLGTGQEFGLKRVGVDGGTPTPVLTAWPAEILDVSWNRDGTVLFVDARGSVMTVAADGGAPVPLIEESGARHPQLLPGGESLLFSTGPNLVSRAATGVGGTSQIVVRSLVADDRRVIWEGGSQPRYLEETGQIVYQGTTEPGLWAFSFDLGRLEKTGDPVPMVEGPIVDFDVSDTGSLAYALAVDLPVGEAGGSSVLVLSDRTGNVVRRLRTDPGPYQNPRVSPDGTRVAYEFVDTSGQSHIWVYDLMGDFPRRLTNEGRNFDPVWKDDQLLTFASEREGAWGVYTQAADGSEAAVELVEAPEGTVYRPQAWASPNAPQEILVLSVTSPGEVRSGSLAMLGPDSQVTPIEPAEPGAAEFGAVLSPDGTLLAYMQQCEAFPGCARFHRFPPIPGASVEISTGVGWTFFSPDGAELLSLISQSTLGVRDVVSAGAVEFPVSGSIPLGGSFGLLTNRSYDLRGPDGDELVIVIPESQTEDAGEDQGIDAISSQIDFFHDFVDVLKERVLPSQNRQAVATGTSQ